MNGVAIIEINDDSDLNLLQTKSIKKSASPPPSSSDDRKTRTRDQNSNNSNNARQSESDPPPPKRLRSSPKNGVQDRVISNCETPAVNSSIKNEVLYVVKENSFKCEYVTENGICDYWTSTPKKIFEHIVLFHRLDLKKNLKLNFFTR